MHSYLLILLLSTCGTVFAASLDSSVLDRRATCKGVPSMYNDTITNAGQPRLVQGSGAKYVNFLAVNQSIGAAALAPPSPPYALGSQLSLGGLPSMAPREGLLHLRSLRFACGTAGGGASDIGTAVDTPAPCTLDVVCESVRKRTVTQGLTYYPSGARGQRFASATFPQDDFSYLTGCLFNLTSTAVANVQDIALLLDDIQYQIERY